MDIEEKNYLDRCIDIYNKTKEKGRKIQEKYLFIIPDYILEELVKNEIDRERVNYFINLARMSNRIDEKSAEILKNIIT